MLKKIVAAFLPPVVLNVRDFSPLPGGRRRTDGGRSGEAYREDVLLPILRSNRDVIVNFDGLVGAPSAWLNEVFAHEATRKHRVQVRFASTGYATIYDKICRNFLTGLRPYTG